MEPAVQSTSRQSPSRASPFLIRLIQTGLATSIVMLAIVPLAVGDGYSMVDDILSGAGGQGVAGAWVFRTAVLVTSWSVTALVSVPGTGWEPVTRRLMGIYAGALALLVVFPDAPWDGRPHDGFVAWLHTAAGVVAVVAFILAVFTVRRRRPRDHSGRRTYDSVVISAMAIIPQLMVALPADGVLQRVMVAIGYVWLLLESGRIADLARSQTADPV